MDLIFLHQTSKVQELNPPQKRAEQEFVENLCNHLCSEDVVFIDEVSYCRCSLPEFIADMDKKYCIDLSSIVDSHKSDLEDIFSERVQNITDILNKNN